MSTRDGNDFAWPAWDAETTAAFLSRALRRRKRPISPRTVQRWARDGRLPAQRQRDGRRVIWLFEPDEVRNWVLGSLVGTAGRFKLAYYPRAALQQIRDLLRDICDPEHAREGWKFETGQQENLCVAIRTILHSPHYASIWPAVRHLARVYRGNPALVCLEDIGGLF